MQTLFRLATVLIATGLWSYVGQPIMAQIQPDDTLGVEQSRVSSGIINTLPSEIIHGGARRGANLFHSFFNFNVAEGQRVYFTNPAGVSNILTRITGNTPSAILGTLGVDGTANLFLLNPNGILFGANSQLDIRGSLTATTANSFIFPDGSQFGAVRPTTPPLLTINITPGLQYGTRAATITNAGKLVTGGDLTLAGGNVVNTGSLIADGNLSLMAQNTVQIRDSLATSLVLQSKGALLIQGNQLVDIYALNTPNSGLFSGGDMVLRSPNAIIGDAHYWTNGNFRIEQPNHPFSSQPLGNHSLDGNSLGNLVSPNDPIIRASGDVIFNGYIGNSLHILAGGKVSIAGGVRITGPGSTADTLQETIRLSNGSSLNIDGSLVPTLDIRAGTQAFGVPGITTTSVFFINPVGALNPPNLVSPATGSDILVGDINITVPNGMVFLTNNYAPNPNLLGGDITVQGTNFFGTGIGVRTDSTVGDSGSITIDASRNLILNSPLNTSSVLGNAGNITLLAGDITSINQSISGDTQGAGRASQISIVAPRVVVQNGASISANTFGPGAGGNVNVTAQTLTLQQNAQLTALTGDDLRRNPLAMPNSGAGGNIILDVTDSINLLNQSVITTQTNQLSTGTAGNLSIRTNNLTLQGGSYLAATTQGNGQGGDITLNIANSLVLQGTSTANTQTGIYLNSFSSGNAGNLTIFNGKQISLSDGALIAASASSSGNAGNITVNAPEAKMQIARASIAGTNASSILSETSGSGNGGDIRINVYQLVLQDGGQIAGQTIGAGNAGTLNISVSDSLVLFGRTGKFASRLMFDSANNGNAGILRIQTPLLRVTSEGQISGRTSVSGRGGLIEVIAPRAVELDRGSLFFDSSGSGNPRGIRVITGQLMIQNSGQLTVSSTQSAIAGDIEVLTNSIFMNNGARITATTASGEGGNIRLQAKDTIILRRDSDIRTQAYGTGNGGNIRIEAGKLILGVLSEDSDVIASAVTGRGGNIYAKAAGIFGFRLFDRVETAESDFVASSQFGLDGTVTINGRDSLPTAPLPTELVPPFPIQGCLASPRAKDNQPSPNRFFDARRGGLPPNPADSLSHGVLWEDAREPMGDLVSTTTPTAIPTFHPPNQITEGQIIEANALARDAAGNLWLVADETAAAAPQFQPQLNCYGQTTPDKSIPNP